MWHIVGRLATTLCVLLLLTARAPAADADKASSPADGTQYDLRYKLKAGELMRYKIVHRAIVDTTIQNTNQTAETRSTSIKVWKIESVSPAGEMALVHSVESIDMWQKMQGREEVRFNSQTDEKAPPGYEDAAKAVGIPLTAITIDSRGNLLKREEKHPQPNASSTLVTIPLPKEPVAVGFSWSSPLDMEVVLPGGTSRKIETRQQFTLEKVRDGIAIIQIESQVLTPVSDPAIEAQLVQRLSNGKLLFDIERGRVVSQQLDLDRRVIGFSGPASSMHYVTRFNEDLLANKPATTAKKPSRPAAGKQPARSAGKPAQRPTKR